MRNELEPPEDSGMSSILRSNSSLTAASEVPNPLPMLLKLHGSDLFADEVPRIEKRGNGELTKAKHQVSPIASTSRPVRHKVAAITPFIDLDATGVLEIHSFLRLTIDGGLCYPRTRV